MIEKYGVYSRECANAMAETAQKKLHTDIAIGITGTTGNVDPNNADSVQGQVYFCIRMGKENHTYELETVVSEMNRHEIKQMYAVFSVQFLPWHSHIPWNTHHIFQSRLHPHRSESLFHSDK